MESLLAKISLFFSLILGSLGSAYIQLDTTNLNFNFRTGDSEPIYFLTISNRGPQKARFSVSTDAGWITVYRETQPGVTSVEISQTGALAFIIEIHPRELTDGSHRGRVMVKAFNPLGYEEQLDSREVAVALNKNLPAVTVTSLPAASVTPTTILTPTGTPLTPAGTPAPRETVKPSKVPTAVPTKTKEPPVRETPSPKLSPRLPLPAAEQETKTLLKSIWQFIKGLFD